MKYSTPELVSAGNALTLVQFGGISKNPPTNDTQNLNGYCPPQEVDD
jgi:hypothetical protein